MNMQYLYEGLIFALLTGGLLAGCDSGNHDEHMEDSVDSHSGEHRHEDEQAGHDETHAGTEGEERGTETADEASLSGKLEDGVRIVDVKARRFEFDPARIIVSKGENVRLKVTSEDVTHGIGIPEFEINRKLQSEETEVIEFQPDKAGTYHFHCTVYCGTGHDRMHGELVVREN